MLAATALQVSASDLPERSLLLGVAKTVRSPGEKVAYGSIDGRVRLPRERLSGWGDFEFQGTSRYVSGGLFLTLFDWPHARLGVGGGPGYLNGGEHSLGSRLEFRNFVELQVKLPRGYYWAVALCHYSNAGFGAINPGSESLRFSLGIPLR